MKRARRRWSSLLADIGYGAAHLNSVTALALHVEQRDAHRFDVAHRIDQRHEGAVLLHVIHAAGNRPVMAKAKQVGPLLPRREREAAERLAAAL